MVVKPMILHGHERPVVRVRINRDGDLVFTAGKDRKAQVWFIDTGERLGTYDKIEGAINDMDVTWDSKHMMTVDGLNHLKLFDVQTGKCINTITGVAPLKSCAFSYSSNLIAVTSMPRKVQNTQIPSALRVIDLRDPEQFTNGMKTPLSWNLDSAGTCCVFTVDDRRVAVGTEDGQVCMYDTSEADSNEPHTWHKHEKAVTDLQMSRDETLLISSSKDKTAQLYVASSMAPIGVKFKSPRPINSAAISPTREHVMVGGGEDAMTVTQTAGSAGHFEAMFFHMIYGEHFANIKGHYSPINSLAYCPNGNTFVTGAEEGLVRVVTFDEEFLEFDLDG